MKIAEVVARNIKRLRQDRGWTQAQLATLLRSAGLEGCTGTRVGKIENDQQRADHLGLIAPFCQVFQEPVTSFLQGDDAVEIAHNAQWSLHDVRLALVGVLPPTEMASLDVQIMDDYNVDRITELAGLEHEGQLRLISVALFDRSNILEWRDQRAGITIRPGTRDEIRTRRARATKVIVAEIKEAVAQRGLGDLVHQGLARLREIAGVES